MFFGTAFTIVMVPYNAILSDMTSDYNERTSFTTVRMLFSGGASLLAAVVPGTLIKLFGGSVNGPAQKPGYLIMAAVMATIFGLCWLFAFLGTREKKDLPPPEKITLRDWLSPFTNKAYRNYLGIFLSFQVAVDLVLALFIFYIDIVVLKYSSYELVMGVLLVFSLVFMAVMGAAAQKKGKVFPLFIGMPVWILTMIAFLFTNSATPVYLLCALAVFIAVGSASGNLSTWSMLTDVFDIDEIRTAKRREGIYSGLTTFLRKFASGVAVLLLGFGLQALGFDQNQYNTLKASGASFDPSAYAQSSLVSGLKWMFVLIPGRTAEHYAVLRHSKQGQQAPFRRGAQGHWRLPASGHARRPLRRGEGGYPPRHRRDGGRPLGKESVKPYWEKYNREGNLAVMFVLS